MAIKATLINPQGQKVVVDSGSPQAQQYFSQGYKLDTKPAVTTNSTLKNTSTTPMITGYKNGVAVQIPKGVYVPGVSLTPPTKVGADTLTSTSGIDKLAEAKASNQTLAQQQETAGTVAGQDQFSQQLNENIKTIKDSGALSQTYTPQQQAQNKTDLLAKQGQIRDLGLQTTKAQSNVDFNPNILTSQGSMSKQQIEREASFKQTALSNEEANLLSSVNLSAQEQQNIINGTNTIADYQDKIQTHIDSAKQNVLDQAKQLTTDQQNKFAMALEAYKGVDVDKLTAEQTATFSKIVTDAGLDPQLVFQGIKAVNAQQALDNYIKNKDNWTVDTTTGLMYNKDTGEVKYTSSSEGGQTNAGGVGVVTDATGNSYDISYYATDPNHEKAVSSLVSNIGQFKSISDINNYIKQVAPNSPVTGEMIAKAAEKYGVSWEVMTAMMQQDSSLGTAGKGARTFNPGNVGNDDSGNIKNYGNWQSGVDAVAQWLSKHKTDANVAPQQNDILSQSGLGILAYNYLTQGISSLTRLNAGDRKRAMKEAEDFVKSKGIDYETFQSQYKTYNEVLSQNMKRFNNTKIMENEVLGTLDNLSTAITDADLGNLKIENVGRIMAGEQINDPQAMKVVFHTQQLRNEMAGYFAATQGKTSPDVIDNQDAAEAIKNGLSTGSVAGLKQAVENSTVKMGAVLQNSVDYTQNQVRSLFNVKPNIVSSTTQTPSSPTNKVVDDYLNTLTTPKTTTQSDSWFTKILKSIGLK